MFGTAPIRHKIVATVMGVGTGMLIGLQFQPPTSYILVGVVSFVVTLFAYFVQDALDNLF
jgi:hypothetical protein